MWVKVAGPVSADPAHWPFRRSGPSLSRAPQLDSLHVRGRGSLRVPPRPMLQLRTITTLLRGTSRSTLELNKRPLPRSRRPWCCNVVYGQVLPLFGALAQQDFREGYQAIWRLERCRGLMSSRASLRRLHDPRWLPYLSRRQTYNLGSRLLSLVPQFEPNSKREKT